jgi:hypothetical protein
MPADTVTHYTAQRAELLANLVLTRRKDVRILSLGDKDDVGIDLIAHLMTPIAGLTANPYFGVQVKGTSRPLEDERAANRLANQAVRGMTARAFILAPIVLMAFSMEGDKGYWGWVMEPLVNGPNRPSLARAERMDMKEINNRSLDGLFESVTSWFEAMEKVLLCNKQEKELK